MTIALRIISVVLLALAVMGARWAYAGFMLSSLLYFPAKAAFAIEPHGCEMIPSWALAVYSFHNYAHITLFAFVFIVSAVHFSKSGSSTRSIFWKAAVGSLIYGAVIEIGEGLSGQGHCRLRDLLPDSLGILIGISVILAWQRVRERRPAQ